MEYRYLGTYRRGLSVEAGAGGVLVETADCTKHFVEVPFGIEYRTAGNRLHFGGHTVTLKTGFARIFVSERYAFVGYEDRLEVMRHDGTAFRLFPGHSVLYACGLFLVSGGTAFVVDGDANTVFTRPQTDVVGFADNGDVLCLKSGGAGQARGARFLAIESLRSQRIYSARTEPVFEMEDISVYKDGAAIQDVVCASHFYATEAAGEERLLCHVVLCRDSVFLIVREFVACKRLTARFSRIVTGRFLVHSFLQETSFYELVLALGMFVRIRPRDAGRTEDFLCRLVLHRKCVALFIGTAVQNGEFSARDTPGTGARPHRRVCTASTIVCRAYRRVDDRGKDDLEPYIAVRRLPPDDLYYIIIYKLSHLDHFIKLCIADRRLFYLEELVHFYEKIGRAGELRTAFLQNGLFIFRYAGLEKVAAMEKAEIDAQRRDFAAFG